MSNVKKYYDDEINKTMESNILREKYLREMQNLKRKNTMLERRVVRLNDLIIDFLMGDIAKSDFLETLETLNKQGVYNESI